MKYLILPVLLCLAACNREQNPACLQLEQILSHEQFALHFGLCENDDPSIMLYNSGEGDDKGIICESLSIPCGKAVHFAEADFPISLNEVGDTEVINPRITYFRSGKKYQFFETGTNRVFVVTFNEQGSIEDVSYGKY